MTGLLSASSDLLLNRWKLPATTEPDIVEVQIAEELKTNQLTISLPAIEQEEPISVVVYPNPASIDISFNIENPKQPNSGEYQLSIFTLQGKACLSEEFQR